MKNYKLNPLAAVIMATLALAGCNSEELAKVTDSATNSGSAEQTEGTGTDTGTDTGEDNGNDVVATSAAVSVGVKFPKPEISPAWIGDSTTIDVEFYATGIVGSQGDAWTVKSIYEACYGDTNGDDPAPIPDGDITCSDAHEGALKGSFATSVSLTPDSSRATINLIPGKYRIEAKFYNNQSQLQETSVSYVTLGEGSHSLKLRGIEATWTADKPLALTLLNNTTEDWDPITDGMQTAAEALGINGEIVGLHLPSALTYPGRTSKDQAYFQDLLVNAGVLNADKLQPADYATAFQSILRVKRDGQEENVLPTYFAESTPTYDEAGDQNGSTHLWKSSSLAFLFQEYTPAGEYTGLLLGDRYIGISENKWNENTWKGRFANLEMGLFNPVATETSEPVYSINYVRDEATWDPVQEAYIEPVQVADISSYIGGHNFWQNAFIELSGVKNTFVDGNTVQGYMVESVSSEVREWNTDVEAAMYLSASLEKIAVAEGLKASSAEANCTELEFGGVSQDSTQYRWDEENQRWVAGMVNTAYKNRLNHAQGSINHAVQMREANIVQMEELAAEFPDSADTYLGYAETSRSEIDALYQVEAEYYPLMDLNKDGVATLFEDGVFPVEPWTEGYCHLNEAAEYDEDYNYIGTTFSIQCDNIATKTLTSGNTWQATGKMCIQPFTLRASKLDVAFDTDGNIVIE